MDLGGRAVEILTAIKRAGRRFNNRVPRSVVAVLAGYVNDKKPGFQKKMSELRNGGFMLSHQDDGSLELTENGRFATRHVPMENIATNAEFHERLRSHLTTGKTTDAFNFLADGRTCTLAELADALAYDDRNSSGFQKMKTIVRRFAEHPHGNRDLMRLPDSAFPFEPRPMPN